ncbi:MAG: hypothetical protein J3R72DRAFT_494364 [Linnemannia gamsii]|nr:MAG: hypothetical protein J3R72DRAFT_494364 [Linnemannia gamsii]
MKFNILFAALAATAAASLPTRIFTLDQSSNSSLEKRRECHTTSLRWSISAEGIVLKDHIFTFSVNYADGQSDYVKSLSISTVPQGERCILGIFLTGIIPADCLAVWEEWCKSRSAACSTMSSQPALASDNSTHSEFPSLSRPSKTLDKDEGSSTQRQYVVEESSDDEGAVSWEVTDNEQ